MDDKELSVAGAVAAYNGKNIEIKEPVELTVDDNVKIDEKNKEIQKKEKIVDADPKKDDTLF